MLFSVAFVVDNGPLSIKGGVPAVATFENGTWNSKEMMAWIALKSHESQDLPVGSERLTGSFRTYA